jgi:zinc protease
MSRIPLLLALICVGACTTKLPTVNTPENSTLPAGMKLIERVEKTGDTLTIPYEKYRLDNGLTVILHEDRSDPLVHLDVTYHVGSAREEIGKSGFAHFFEHMMFQGSKHVADEQHFRIVSESGGTLNGTTNTDRTNYYQTVPSNQLEKMVWLEADRMGFLLEAVTPEKFEVQRETVKNERGQRVDNRPYGQLSERVSEALHPEGHPYSWPTIGHMADLDRVNLADLKQFFLRWYVPNNATLTIGGDFDREQTLAWVQKYFGPIPRGPVDAMPQKSPVTLDADRYLSMEDDVALPLVYMAWPTVYARHPDEAPLDVLMFLVGSDRTSLLYKNMIKNGLAVQAEAGHACGERACSFTMSALPNPTGGATLEDLEQIARNSLEEFEQRGISEEELERIKTRIVSGMIYSLESVAGKVSQLAANETFTGNPDYIGRDIARYENVTAVDVLRVYRQYLKNKPAVVMSVVPRGEREMIAHADTWPRPERNLPDYEQIEEADLPYRPVVDTFDRSVVTPAGPNPAISLPELWRGELANGVAVLGTANTETPTTAVNLRIAVGQRHEPLDQLGLAALTAAMMNEATLDSSNEELSHRLQRLGSSITFGAGDEQTGMSIHGLSENLDETLAIAAEKLLMPKFDEDDFERVKGQMLQAIAQQQRQPAAIAAAVYQQLLFGQENTFAYADIGTEATLRELTVDDVRRFYTEHYSPQIASIVAISSVPQAELLDKLGVFGTWEGPGVETPALAPFPENGTGKVYLVDKPGAAQSEIRIGKRSLAFDATGEYYRASLSNFALGGAFNSRININLREDKGYTYGARSYFNGSQDYGLFTASAGVRTDATAASIVALARELRTYHEKGITDAELAFTRRAIGQSDARSYETPWQKLGFLSRILTYDLPDDFVARQNAILAEIDRDEINRLARRHITVDDMIIVVVGDKDAILPDIEALGYEVVELDADGNGV